MNFCEQKNLNEKRCRSTDICWADGTVDYYPLYIQLEHTNFCNAHCIMCNHFFLGNSGAGDLSREAADALEPVLSSCRIIMLNGDGEPFLCHDLERYVKRYAGYGVQIGCNTNFCYVPDNLWECLKTDFAFLNISCDGATKETYERIRRGLSFRQFLENIEHLNRAAPALRKNLDCVLMKQNIAEASELVKLAAAYGFSEVRFHMLGVNPCIGNRGDAVELRSRETEKALEQAAHTGEVEKIRVRVPAVYGMNGTAAFSPTERRTELPAGTQTDQSAEKAESWDKEIAERYKRSVQLYGHLALDEDYLSNMAGRREIVDMAWKSGRACRWGLERCYIDRRGNVTTCCYNPRFRMGNLMEKSFDEIWNGRNYRLFRLGMKNGNLPCWCRECAWIRNPAF